MRITRQMLFKNWAIYGSTGAGKTYFVERKILKKLEGINRTILIIDSKNSMKGYQKKGYREYYSLGLDDLADILTGLRKGRSAIIHKKGTINPKSRSKLFALFDYCRDVTCYIDEASFVLNWPDYVNESKYRNELSFIRTMTGAHNLGHNIILATQFPGDCPKHFERQCHYQVYHKLDLSEINSLSRKGRISLDTRDELRSMRGRHPRILVR